MENKEEPKAIRKLEITLLSNGQVSVDGPLNDRVLCYGLLRLADEVIHEYKNKKPTIIQNGEVVDFVRRKN